MLWCRKKLIYLYCISEDLNLQSLGRIVYVTCFVTRLSTTLKWKPFLTYFFLWYYTWCTEISYILKDWKNYIKILLIWLTWDKTGAKLSNILDYQTVPVLNEVLTGNFLLLFLYTWAVQLIRGVFYLGILGIFLICWFRAIRVLFCVFWSLYSWRSWQIRRQGVTRYHNRWHTNTLGGFFEPAPVSFPMLFFW